MTSLNIVFAGTPEFALPSVKTIAQSQHRLMAVYTQPDRPAGRGRKLQASPIKTWAIEQNIPVFQPLNFKSQESIDKLRALRPDVMVVIAYGLILPQAVLDIPKLGCVNVHASLLPAWRGASPIQQAVLHGDTVSGVTIMQMDAGMDTGPALATVECPIESNDTAGTLHDKLAKISATPLIETLDKLAAGTSKPVSQNNDQATYAPKIEKAQAKINWARPALAIERQVKAFNPWPIAFTEFGELRIRIHQAQALPSSTDKTPGTIIAIDKSGILVATDDGALLIEQLQFPGKKKMRVLDWLNSDRSELRAGAVFA